VATAPDPARPELAATMYTRGINVTVNGTAYPATIVPGLTAAHLLAAVKESVASETGGLQLHTADGLVLRTDDDLWSVVRDGETIYAFPEPANAKHTNPAAVRCPGCWDQ
jgi:hypothetical protein